MKFQSCLNSVPIMAKRTIAVLTIVLVLALSLMPTQYIPPETGLFHVDKLIHVLMYFGVTATVLWAATSSKFNRNTVLFWLVIVLFGVLMEVLQGVLPIGRNFSVNDILANTAGCIVGVLFYNRFNFKKPVGKR